MVLDTPMSGFHGSQDHRTEGATLRSNDFDGETASGLVSAGTEVSSLQGVVVDAGQTESCSKENE